MRRFVNLETIAGSLISLRMQQEKNRRLGIKKDAPCNGFGQRTPKVTRRKNQELVENVKREEGTRFKISSKIWKKKTYKIFFTSL